MSAAPSASSSPRYGGSANTSPSKQNGSRWGTISGNVTSPVPAPTSGVSVRRNHTVHGARHHDKPRLEKHFEQPETAELQYASAGEGSSDRHSPPQPSISSSDGLSSPSAKSDFAADEYSRGLVPLQALYTKATVSRNHSLPSRHSSRLASHLLPHATRGTSSLFNSLSAITGGLDHDEHEWEKMIGAGSALGDDSREAEEHLSSPWSDSTFSHRRFASDTNSAQPHSPIGHNDHHRSDSSSAMEALEQGPFASASSPLGGGSGLIRRHQSLNHHSGRAAAQRLSSQSSDLLQGEVTTSHTPPSQAFSPKQSSNLSAASSPIVPGSYSKAPWNQPSGQPGVGSPSRFANSFPSNATEARSGDQQQLDMLQPRHGRVTSSDSISPSLMDIHASLAKLDIRGSLQPIGGESIDSRESMTPTGPPGLHDTLPPRPNLATRDSSSDVSSQAPSTRKLPSLITNRDVLARGAVNAGGAVGGPVSAAAYVPPIGHAHSRQTSTESSVRQRYENDFAMRMGPFTAAPAPGWREKELFAGAGISDGGAMGHDQLLRAAEQWGLGLGSSNAGLGNAHVNTLALSLALAQEQQRTAIMQAQAGMGALPEEYGMRRMDASNSIATLNRQLRGATGTNFVQPNMSFPGARSPGQAAGSSPPAAAGETAEVSTPIDTTSLVMQKGYNPAPGTFNLNPPAARFFVIKSYTEDDVHKSLKYEIWASTDKGNQRLDKAFRESAHVGPIYLFFSVNASGHFCGMAQMSTPLDYTTSSNVWAQDGKWKGTFRVRWIYVKDLPNNQLRHIRLTNTPEVKPVTQSRDTQELTREAGREVLRIMADFPAKTSLLQDFNFYESQSKKGRNRCPQGTAAAQRAGLGPSAI